ncbi:hypothetical protein Tco_1434494, partial [Tanacetum coccineum]
AKHIEYMKCVKNQTPKQAKRGRDTKIPQSGSPLEKLGDEAVHKELGERMERAATTAFSLEAEQDSGSGPRIGVDTARHILILLGKVNTVGLKVSTVRLNLVLLVDEGSEGFHQIVDFLNSTHINTSENGEMEITATIDGRVKTVTEASIRRHLKLEDSDSIITLPNTKIFEQLALMGTNGVSTTSTKLVLSELVNTARRMINTADGQSC